MTRTKGGAGTDASRGRFGPVDSQRGQYLRAGLAFWALFPHNGLQKGYLLFPAVLTALIPGSHKSNYRKKFPLFEDCDSGVGESYEYPPGSLRVTDEMLAALTPERRRFFNEVYHPQFNR